MLYFIKITPRNLVSVSQKTIKISVLAIRKCCRIIKAFELSFLCVKFISLFSGLGEMQTQPNLGRIYAATLALDCTGKKGMWWLCFWGPSLP